MVRATFRIRVYARAQSEAVDRQLQQPLAGAVDLAVSGQLACAHLCVAKHPLAGEAFELNFARLIDALANRDRRFSRSHLLKLLVLDRWDIDMNIDTVEKGARNTRTIALNHLRRTGAFVGRIAVKAAWAWVHRGDQHDARWKGEGPHHA